LVANYTQLRLYADAFAAESWDAVILDEGQNIKNPASATAQAARALRTAHRLVLTGTPVENRLLDLWSLFSFAQPGLLGGQTSFKRLYNDKTDPAARTRLAQRVKHFLLRRTKSQVARDLPARIEEEIVVELEGPQRALYDAELKRTRVLLLGVKNNRDFDSQRFNILQSLLRLRQICCDPRLVGAGELPKAPSKKSAAKSAAKSAPASSAISHSKSKKTSSSSASAAASDSQLSAPDSQLPSASPNSLPLPSAKLEALLDTLEPLMAEGHKVLVFSQFVTMLELIRVELTARGIAHLLLTGQTENRQALVDKFQSDPAIPVFLLSLKAAGSGLNLTAASYVVLFDPWWNPAVEAQAIDRTHRIGQKNQVMAYRLIARNTVEEKIRALQKEKAAMAAAVVQEESLATVLDLASLRAILA
jgi:SNF2 family DNA or RNA helicase